ncbi:MAG: hypothetical protein WCK67_12120 [bacterium]
MKKKIATALLLLATVTNATCTYAEELITQNAYQAKPFEIIKEKYNLKSYLKEKNHAYTYKIKNTSSENIYLTQISSVQNPHQFIVQKQQNRALDIFSKTGELIVAPIGLAIGAIGFTVTIPGTVFYGTSYLISKDKLYLDSIPNTSHKSLNLMKESSLSLISVPYLAVSLPARDLIAINEANKFKLSKFPLKIAPNKTFALNLFDTGKTERNMEFSITTENNNQTYTIDKNGNAITKEAQIHLYQYLNKD